MPLFSLRCPEARLHASLRPPPPSRASGSRRLRPATRASHATATQQPPAARRTGPVVALSNLCVDIVQEVAELPASGPPAARRELYSRLMRAPPPVDSAQVEVGGNTNFAIAAARLGLRVTCLGHTGGDVYGAFLGRVLGEEGVRLQQLLPRDAAPLPDTLLVWVLIDPRNGHDFCSRFDFDTQPLLACAAQLPPAWTHTLATASAVFVNGFVFDDLQPETVLAASRAARAGGAVLAFDVGPRARPLSENIPAGGTLALRELVQTADVLLLTAEEAAVVTGCAEAEEAAAVLLRGSLAPDPWVVVKLGAGGCLALTRSGRVALPAVTVEALDTVGCGDSFAAAVVLGRGRGASLSVTLGLANGVGAATAMARGAGRNVARVPRVRELLQGCAVGGEGEAERAAAQGALTLLEEALAEAAAAAV